MGLGFPSNVLFIFYSLDMKRKGKEGKEKRRAEEGKGGRRREDLKYGD